MAYKTLFGNTFPFPSELVRDQRCHANLFTPNRVISVSDAEHRKEFLPVIKCVYEIVSDTKIAF